MPPMKPSLPDKLVQRLITRASEARTHAYAPYSHYTVGAALLTTHKKIVVGCNVENASYGLTICAERGAIMAAVAQGQRDFQAIAVVTGNGGSPCGACRQFIAEFGGEIVVIISDAAGQFRMMTAAELLPDSFDKIY